MVTLPVYPSWFLCIAALFRQDLCCFRTYWSWLNLLWECFTRKIITCSFRGGWVVFEKAQWLLGVGGWAVERVCRWLPRLVLAMNQNNINVFTCPRNRNTMSKQASLKASPTSGLALKTAFASGLSGCLAWHGLFISRRILSPRPWQVFQGVRECTKCRNNHNHCRAHCTYTVRYIGIRYCG